MNQGFDAETAISVPDAQEPRLPDFLKSLVAPAAFILNLASASTMGARRCFVEPSAATEISGGILVASSTQLREVTPGIRARLEALLDAARDEVIEDGMRNVVNERLPGFVVKHPTTVIPALLAVIESGRATPIVAAEVLKELGRLRNADSHRSRRWVLERALSSKSPITRDGAGLGLARLADPCSLPYLRRAVESELDSQTKADLQLVINELLEATDGAPAADHH